MLGIHGGQQGGTSPHGYQRRPGDLVLARMMLRQLIVEVGPRGGEPGATLHVAGREALQRSNESGQVASKGTVNRLVHTHLGHAQSLVA